MTGRRVSRRRRHAPSSKRSTVRQPVASSISIDVDRGRRRRPSRVEPLEHRPRRSATSSGVTVRPCTSVTWARNGTRAHAAPPARPAAPARRRRRRPGRRRAGRCPMLDRPQRSARREAHGERRRRRGRRGDELVGPVVIDDVVDERDVASDAAAHDRVPAPRGSRRRCPHTGGGTNSTMARRSTSAISRSSVSRSSSAAADCRRSTRPRARRRSARSPPPTRRCRRRT